MAANSSTSHSSPYAERIWKFSIPTSRENFDNDLRIIKQQAAEDLTRRIATYLQTERSHVEDMLGGANRGGLDDIIDRVIRGFVPNETLQRREGGQHRSVPVVDDLTEPGVNCTSCHKDLKDERMWAYDRCGCVVCSQCAGREEEEEEEESEPSYRCCPNGTHHEKHGAQRPRRVYGLSGGGGGGGGGCGICFRSLRMLSKRRDEPVIALKCGTFTHIYPDRQTNLEERVRNNNK
ncbi:hypothetical protein F4809DRAFT_646791 [Biscogniauxia mediterranea]|nr:hypothetical protein F4809DRAFT_646791 [Biscogniauxia mediterranea]